MFFWGSLLLGLLAFIGHGLGYTTVDPVPASVPTECPDCKPLSSAAIVPNDLQLKRSEPITTGPAPDSASLTDSPANTSSSVVVQTTPNIVGSTLSSSISTDFVAVPAHIGCPNAIDPSLKINLIVYQDTGCSSASGLGIQATLRTGDFSSENGLLTWGSFKLKDPIPLHHILLLSTQGLEEVLVKDPNDPPESPPHWGMSATWCGRAMVNYTSDAVVDTCYPNSALLELATCARLQVDVPGCPISPLPQVQNKPTCADESQMMYGNCSFPVANNNSNVIDPSVPIPYSLTAMSAFTDSPASASSFTSTRSSSRALPSTSTTLSVITGRAESPFQTGCPSTNSDSLHVNITVFSDPYCDHPSINTTITIGDTLFTTYIDSQLSQLAPGSFKLLYPIPEYHRLWFAAGNIATGLVGSNSSVPQLAQGFTQCGKPLRQFSPNTPINTCLGVSDSFQDLASCARLLVDFPDCPASSTSVCTGCLTCTASEQISTSWCWFPITTTGSVGSPSVSVSVAASTSSASVQSSSSTPLLTSTSLSTSILSSTFTGTCPSTSLAAANISMELYSDPYCKYWLGTYQVPLGQSEFWDNNPADDPTNAYPAPYYAGSSFKLLTSIPQQHKLRLSYQGMEQRMFNATNEDGNASPQLGTWFSQCANPLADFDSDTPTHTCHAVESTFGLLAACAELMVDIQGCPATRSLSPYSIPECTASDQISTSWCAMALAATTGPSMTLPDAVTAMPS